MAYTKEDMAKDIVNLLKGDFSDFLKDAAMEKILWAATERRESDSRAKYRRCKYWSKNALLYAYGVYSIDQVINNTSYKGDKDLRHEHVIPKAAMKKCFKEWAEDKSLTTQELSDKIRGGLKNAVACVIKKEQADTLDGEYKSAMPNSREDISIPDNTWARYENFNDTIYEVTWVKNGRYLVIAKLNEKI